MKSNYKIFTAVFLSAIMTAAAPLTVCGAEVFSAGESFSDGTGSIPAILTDMVLPDGEIGTEYQVQLEADTDVNWSLEEGSAPSLTGIPLITTSSILESPSAMRSLSW